MDRRPTVEEIRARFPALGREENGRTVAYLDGPGGTQVPESVANAIAESLRAGVSNLGGGFGASDAAEDLTRSARAAAGRLFNADPAAVSFGQNMTSLTFAVSRALAANWAEGDAIVLTSLDHDANFTPWVMAANEVGAEIRVAEFDVRTGILDPAAVAELIDDRVRLVAVCLAANSIGTVVDVAAITAAAREVGAITYVDAVHAVPHLRIDVGALGCDLLVASAYKFFGPHTGLLFGEPSLMSTTKAYKVRPAPSDPPGKWETGTQSFESLAGVTAAVEYLESLGNGDLATAYEWIGEHEATLGQRFIAGASSIEAVSIHGVDDMDERRVPTFAVSVDGVSAADVQEAMTAAGVYVWAGHYYAVNAMDRLGVLDSGGLVRIGFVHYNTTDEVDRALEVLASVS